MFAIVSAFPKSLHCTDEAQQAETVLSAVLSFFFRKEGVRINYKLKKIPEGQGYAPRLEPTAPIRLADRNPAHYPSRHCTILKKDGSMTDFQHTQSDPHGSHRKMLHVLLTHLPPRCVLTFSPTP